MIKPIGEKFLVKVIEDELGTGPGGFAKAEGARKDKPLFGEVIADGNYTHPDIKIGSKIYFSSYGYDEIGELVIVPFDLILGVER